MTNKQLCEDFYANRQSIVLSTLDSKGEIESSVAPFVTLDGVLFIYVSELAKHTQNLLLLNKIEDKTSTLISGLLLADESATEQMFARERITLQLSVTEVEREQTLYNEVLLKFSEKFGEVVSMLITLPDFHLFALTPIKGGYVRGFGQAFAFENCPCQKLIPVTRN